jgi:hypothetical protein
MALSYSHATDPEPVKKDRGQQLRFIVFAVVILIVLILLPTPRVTTKSNLTLSQPFLDVIELGHSITHDLSDLRGNSRIIVTISSTENVTAVIASSQGVVYNATGKDHNCTFKISTTSLSISLKNSGPAFVGRSAIVATSVQVYEDYTVERWLPWWMKG